MEVSMKEVASGSAALKRLADNAKLPPVSFFKVLNAWRDVREHLEIYQKAIDNLMAQYASQRQPNGQLGFGNKDDRLAYLRELELLDAQMVELSHVKKPLTWDEVSKGDTNLTPAEVESLLWLVDCSSELSD